MKLKLSLLLGVFFSICISGAYTQTITVNSITESRCAANGTVSLSVSPSAGASDIWRITSAPAEFISTLTPAILPAPFQNNGNFFSLPAGTYTFEYSDGSSSVFETGVVVPGTYVDPVFVIDSVKDAICPGQGEIHVSMSQGNDPYRYRLYSPDSALGNYTPWQASGSFFNLRAETYEVQAEDSCGVIKTISGIFIDHPNGGPLWYDYNGNTQDYYSDEARSIPQNCTQSTVGMYLYRNYAMQQKSSYLRDGDGNVISDMYSTTEKPLELVGGQAPYSYTLTESEGYYFLPEPTDTFNDYRPRPPFTSWTSSEGRNDSIGIVFDVANDLTIYSLGTVGDRSGGRMRLELYDNSGVLLYSKWEEQDINAGNDNMASLGWFIPAGSGYRLVKRTDGYTINYNFSTSPYPISAGDITITGPAGSSNMNRLFSFSSVVYSKNLTTIQGPNTEARFTNVPRTSANSFTIVGTDACGSKIYRSVTTKLPFENIGVRRTAADCGIGNDVLRPNQDFYTTLGQDKAKHFYTYPWMGNDVQGTLPYTYTVTSDIGYSPDPITTDLALLNSSGGNAYYQESWLRNLDGSQWQPDPASTIVVNITDACGESFSKTFEPPSGNIPIENITNYFYDNTACAPWKRYRIYHVPYVDTFETFILNIQTLTPGGAHARIQPSGTGFQNTEYNWWQGFSMRGNVSAYPHFLPGQYEITFTGSCSGNVIKDTITVTPNSFEFDARVIQPCSNTPTARVEITRPSGTSIPTSGAWYVYSGSYDASIDYSVEPFLQEVPYTGNPQSITGLAPGTYTIISGTRNGSYKFMQNCTFYRTITVVSYKDPTLTLAADPVCNPNTTGNIYATVLDGVGPYTYQIRVQGEPIDSFTANSQSSPVFLAKMDTNYDVRVIDSCGQSTVASITTGGLFMPPIQSADTFCVGSEVRIETIAIPGATYLWHKAGVPIVGAPDSNVFVVPSAVLADSGLYSVVTDVAPCLPDTGYHRVSLTTTTNLATINAAPDRFCEGDGDIVLVGGNTDLPVITTGRWTVVSGPSSPLSPSIGSLVNNNTTVTDIVTTDGNPENPYVFRWEIDNGTCVTNAYDTVFVHRKPTTAYPGPDQFLCEATGATLAATSVSFGFGYWTQVSGNPVTIADSTDPSTTILFSGSPIWPDTIAMQWNVVNDSANATCTSQGVVRLYNISSTGTAFAGLDDTSCNDVTYTLSALPVASDSGSGRWFAHSYPGVAPTFNDATLPNATSTLSIAGEYVFVWEVSNGVCPPRYDSVTVFLIKADAGNDIIVCTDNLIGIRMQGDTVPGIPGTWTSSNPALTWSINGARGVDTAIISGITAGVDTIVYTVTEGSCTVTDELILLASNPPSVSIAGPDQLGLCQDTAVLSANSPTEGSGVWTQVSGPNTAIQRDFDSAINVLEGLTIGTYEFVWTISNQPCSPERDTVIIEVTRLPHSTTIFDYENPYCLNLGSITAQAIPNGVPSNYEFSIDSATGGYQPSGVFNGLDTGVYYVWSRDLINSACIARTAVALSLIDTIQRPTLDTVYFEPVRVCNGTTNSGSIHVRVSGGQGPISYSISGSFSASNSTGDFSNLTAGNYSVSATDSLGCPLLLISGFDLPEISCELVVTTDTLVCIDTTEMPNGLTTVTGCDGNSPTTTSNGGTVTIDPLTGCATIVSDFSSSQTDTTCIILCDTILGILVCDTTTIITVAKPTTDTIVKLTNGNPTNHCLTTDELVGSTLTYRSCATPQFGVISNTDTCYTYVPSVQRVDSTCVIICDEFGICDTTVFIYVPPVTPDTILTTNSVICLDTNELLGLDVDSISTCDGSNLTRNGGSVSIDASTGCITTAPDFSSGNTDTTCIIVCKSVAGTAICDTTIIVSVDVPSPDTLITILPSIGGVTVCTDNSELIGTNYTYNSCRGATAGVFNKGSGSCYTYVPLIKQIDSTCVIVCDEYGICDTTVFVFVPKLTTDVVITTDSIVCVDTTEMPAGYHTVTGCDGNSPTTTTNGGTVTIDPITGCATISGNYSTSISDTTCIVVCDTINGICDTTIIVSVNNPSIDTIVKKTNGNPTSECVSTSELLGNNLTYISCGTPNYGVLSNSDTCYNYIPVVNRVDTTCVIICDEFGICDTTVIIYVPPVTIDTVVTLDPTVCVDTNELLGLNVDSIATCDGMNSTSNGGTVSVNAATGCVTTTPDFSVNNTDTTCVVVCKSVAGSVICDTTIIITVQPPTKDTIIQLTNGNPTDTCLSTDEFVGSMYTYQSCGNPVQGVLTVSSDTCFNYTPINNRLDTSCVVICDEYGVCDTTLFIYVPPVTNDTIYTLDTNVCVDTIEIPAGYLTITGCDGNSPSTTSNGGTVTLGADGCVVISPVFSSKTDTTCIVICDTVLGICDTTLIVNMRRATPDTIIECIPRDGMANDSNMNTIDLLGSIKTMSTFKLPKHGQFTLTNDTNSSYQTSPFPILDTVQVSFCDEYNFCDTFTFIYIPPMTPDTIYTQGGGTICVDTSEMPREAYTSISTCDGMGMTSNGGVVSPLSGGCVDIAPDFSTSRVDTTCIILCDTVLPMCECDTTYVISFAPANTDTFAIQLPSGTNTADTCLTTEDLFGTSYTYRRLGAPTPHGPITTHNDTCINYVQTSTTKYLDTARVLICDEYGNCDTTVIVYVPAPDADTLLVGPVIPLSPADTCVNLESTFMTGQHIGTCDGTGLTSGGVPVSISGLCVSYPVPSAIFTGDTACIIVCDTVLNIIVCDTTLIVYLPDTTPPTVVCKDDTVYLDALGTATIDTSNVVSSITDNTLINSVWVTPTNFNCANVGLNSVTLYAVDTNRNIDSCVATITVLDTLSPMAMCQNVTIGLDSNGNASITALDIDAGSTDNCAVASVSVSQTSFDCSHLGTNLVTLTVTDVNGNVSTCTATVTVEDNIAPIVYCPGNKEVIIRNTTCEFTVPDYRDEVTAWDNCLSNGVTFTQSPAAGSVVILNNSDTTITITGTDGTNFSTCNFTLSARCVKELNIPQFISPNTDGRNDTWEIPELVNYPKNVVKVFNRWGNLVFEQKGYYTGWDARSNVDNGANRLMDNKQLPEGTYYYIIDLGEPDTEPYVGYMQIKR